MSDDNVTARDWPKLFRENPELREWAQEFLLARDRHSDAQAAVRAAWKDGVPDDGAADRERDLAMEAVHALVGEPCSAAIQNAALLSILIAQDEGAP